MVKKEYYFGARNKASQPGSTSLLRDPKSPLAPQGQPSGSLSENTGTDAVMMTSPGNAVSPSTVVVCYKCQRIWTCSWPRGWVYLATKNTELTCDRKDVCWGWVTDVLKRERKREII